MPVHLHPPRRVGRNGSVDGVVDQVAEHHQQIAGRLAGFGDQEALSQAEADPAFVGLRRLAQQEGCQGGVVDGLGDGVHQRLALLDGLGGERDRLLAASHLHQHDHRVQPVVGLVGAAAQHVAEGAQRVEFAGEPHQVGAVAQRGHPPQVGAVEHGPNLGDHDGLPAGNEGFAGAHPTRGHQFGEVGFKAQLRDVVAGLGARRAEQFAGLVVAQHHGAVAPDEYQAGANRMQQGLVVGVQPAKAQRPQPARLPVDSPGDRPGAQPGERQRDDGDPRQLERPLRAHPAQGLHRDPGGDRCDHFPLRHHRHNHPYRASEGAVELLDNRAAGLGSGDRALVGAPDLLRIRVGPAGAVGVHHHDEAEVVVDPDLLDGGAERRGRIGRGDRRIHPGRLGKGHCCGLRPGDGLPAGGLLGRPDGEPPDRYRHHQEHQGQQREDLARKAPAIGGVRPQLGLLPAAGDAVGHGVDPRGHR